MNDLREMSEATMLKSHQDNVSMHEAALRTYPDFLLHNTDEYMATLLQQLSDEPTDDLQTIFVVCGYGQSRSIPYYIYMSPKVMENRIDHVCDYLPRYQTIMSKDTTEMQVEKLVLTDLIHGN